MSVHIANWHRSGPPRFVLLFLVRRAAPHGVVSASLAKKWGARAGAAAANDDPERKKENSFFFLGIDFEFYYFLYVFVLFIYYFFMCMYVGLGAVSFDLPFISTYTILLRVGNELTHNKIFQETPPSVLPPPPPP